MASRGDQKGGRKAAPTQKPTPARAERQAPATSTRMAPALPKAGPGATFIERLAAATPAALTMRHLVVLEKAGNGGGPVSARDIAAQTGLSRSSITRMVRFLTGAGYLAVGRKRSDDTRLVDIRRTAKGNKLLAAATPGA